jgi:hypothetical protein
MSNKSPTVRDVFLVITENYLMKKFNIKYRFLTKGKWTDRGYVYIIWLGRERYYKIGRTTNVTKRLSDLKSANPWCELIYSRPVSDAGEVEKILHKMFNHTKVEREIFQLEDVHIQTAINVIEKFSLNEIR